MTTLPELLSSLGDRLRILRWIGGTRNLALLRRRMHRELDPEYLRGFYRTWVWGHARRRLQLQSTPRGTPSPLTIKLSPSMVCNLRCRGCFAADHPSKERLDPDTLERLVEQAEAVGVSTIGVIGGEPLLVRDILDLFRRFPQTGFYLVTNGTLVRPEIVEQLAELPNVVPIVSLEGFEQTTDALRGRGVYAKVMAAMDAMRDGGLVFGFSTTVHRDNVDEVVSARYLDHLIERGAYFGGFIPYIPVGADPMYDLVCTPREVEGYYRRLDELARTRPIGLLKEGYSDGSFFNQGCRAGSTIHVTASGEAEPCNGIEFSTHNVHEHSLVDVLQSPFFQAIRDLHGDGPRRCLVDVDPQRILDAIDATGATPTHAGSREHLERWVSEIAAQ